MYELDKRTLMGINRATLITLPVSWIRNNGLVKGQKVSVWLDEMGRLVITPPEKEHNPDIGAELGGAPPTTGTRQNPHGAEASV